ncbi:hypothetical protein [Pandoraea morbifera]|nr:hypothetical protein [Pandoraea morbifera]
MRALPIKSARHIVDSELDYWEKEVFPVLEALGENCYDYLLNNVLLVLDAQKYRELTSKKLKDTVYRVRQSRHKQGIVSAKPARDSQILLRRPVEPVATPMASTPSKQAPMALKKTVGVVEIDWNYYDVLNRLKTREDAEQWTEQDERIFTFMKQKAAENFVDIASQFYEVEKLFTSSTSKQVVSKLYDKRKRLCSNV